MNLAVLLSCFTYHSVCCCKHGSIVAKLYLSQGLLLYTLQYCYLVLSITVASAVCLAVLLPCFPVTVSAAVDLAILFPFFFLSQCLLLHSWQYCCHVLPVTVFVAVNFAVLLPCFTYHSVCCCGPFSIVTMFYLSQHLLLQAWQYCCHVLDFYQ